MKILQVKKFPIYDIFVGEGWDNWTRILYNNETQTLKVNAGRILSIGERKKIIKRINQQIQEKQTKIQSKS